MSEAPGEVGSPASSIAPQPLTQPRIELICPGCRGVHEHPAEGRGGDVTCPECGYQFHAPASVAVIYMPWEDRGRLGWLLALYDTVRMCILAPKTFFQRMPISGGWLSPLSYVVIVGGVALVLVSLWAFLLFILAHSPESEMTLSAYVGSTVLSGLEALTDLALYSGLMHLAVILLGGASPRMQTTARVVAYACSALLLAVIPYIGPPLALLWTVVLCVIGLRETQELSTAKAIFATLSPLLFFLVMRGFLVAPSGAGEPTPTQ